MQLVATLALPSAVMGLRDLGPLMRFASTCFCVCVVFFLLVELEMQRGGLRD